MNIEVTISNKNVEVSPEFIALFKDVLSLDMPPVELLNTVPFVEHYNVEHQNTAAVMAMFIGESMYLGATCGVYCCECRTFKFGLEFIFQSPCEDHECVEIKIGATLAKGETK